MASEVAGAAVAGNVASKGADLMGILIRAMEKPIYEDTKTTIHISESGKREVIETKGFSIPLGLPVGLAFVVAVWEVGIQIGNAVNQTEKELATVAQQLDPANWVKDAAGSMIPPSMMSGLSLTGLGFLSPLTKAAGDLTKSIAKKL